MDDEQQREGPSALGKPKLDKLIRISAIRGPLVETGWGSVEDIAQGFCLEVASYTVLAARI